MSFPKRVPTVPLLFETLEHRPRRAPRRLPKDIERLAVSVREAAELLAVSPSLMYEQLTDLEARGVYVERFGRRKVVMIGTVTLARLVDGPDAPIPVLGHPLVWRLDEAARLLGLNEKQMRSGVDRGWVPGVCRLGRTVLVSRRQLAARWGLAA